MKKIENMDDDELMEAWTAAGENLEEAKRKNKEFSVEFHRREAEKAIRAKFEAMNDLERAALAQMMVAEGVASEEAVHNG